MQPKVFFFYFFILFLFFFVRELNRHKEFSIISEVLFYVSPSFSSGITLTFVRGLYMSTSVYLGAGGGANVLSCQIL